MRNPDEVTAWLQELGATVVMSDTAPIRVRSCPGTCVQLYGKGVWVSKGRWRQMTLPPLSFCLTQGQLDDLKFFGKPKLGLDAVGGTSAAKLADALVEVHTSLMSFDNPTEHMLEMRRFAPCGS